MKYIRNDSQGYTEVMKNDRLIALTFSVEDLWKRRVHLVIFNNAESVNKRLCRKNTNNTAANL